MSLDPWKNAHKLFIELTPVLNQVNYAKTPVEVSTHNFKSRK